MNVLFEFVHGSASLELALEVAAYFDLDSDAAHKIAAQVGQAVAKWRKEAAKLGLTAAEINRMVSAFEHADLKSALSFVGRGPYV